MSKAVLISIQPKWCKLIYTFLCYENCRPLYKKRLELRKSMPNCELPFKGYIYCTKDNTDLVPSRIWWKADKTGFKHILNGKVIGEFVCDYILGNCEMGNADIAEQMSCVLRKDILKYSNGKEVFGWHISDLILYDKPKELSEFKKAGFLTEEEWLAALYPNTHCHYEAWAKKFDITKPPQSWCYVEEIG